MALAVDEDVRKYFLAELNAAWQGTMDRFETGIVLEDAELESQMMAIALEWTSQGTQWITPTPE